MFISLLVAIILALAGGGTVYASQNALPGDPLYGLKTGIESIQLEIESGKGNAAESHLRFAGERLDEIEELAKRGRYEDIGPAASLLADQIIGVSDPSGDEQVKVAGSHAIEALEAVLAKEGFPDQAVPAIEKALERIRQRMEPPIELPVDPIPYPVDPGPKDGKDPMPPVKTPPVEVPPGPPGEVPVEEPPVNPDTPSVDKSLEEPLFPPPSLPVEQPGK